MTEFAIREREKGLWDVSINGISIVSECRIDKAAEIAANLARTSDQCKLNGNRLLIQPRAGTNNTNKRDF